MIWKQNVLQLFLFIVFLVKKISCIEFMNYENTAKYN